MLHGTICNGDFLRNTALQCWNNVATIWINVATILQRCIAHPLVDRYTKKIRAWVRVKSISLYIWQSFRDFFVACAGLFSSMPIAVVVDVFVADSKGHAVCSAESRPWDKGWAPLSRLLDKKGKGVGRTPEELFSALRASKWRGGERPPRAPPLDPPLVCRPNYITGFFFLLFQHGQHLLLSA